MAVQQISKYHYLLTHSLCTYLFFLLFAGRLRPVCSVPEMNPDHCGSEDKDHHPESSHTVTGVTLIKIGRSYLTNKALFEQLNDTDLDWFTQTVADLIHLYYLLDDDDDQVFWLDATPASKTGQTSNQAAAGK